MKKHRGGFGLFGLAWAVLIVFLPCAITTLFAVPAAADDAMDARHLAERAQFTLETFARAPEMDAFRNLIRSARGVFVAPQVLKGAFIVGASGGSGVLVSRDRLKEQWAGPAFYTIGSASVGFQIGGNASEVVLLAMTDRGVNALLETSVKLGADVGVAVGPVGMGAAASTANLSADIVSVSRAKGLFAGISLDGAMVKTREDLNDAYYGSIVTPSDILLKRNVANPHAGGLLEEVSKLAAGPTRPARRPAEPVEPARESEPTVPAGE
jgi:SH3 domain-containing YSC84-like protein 1